MSRSDTIRTERWRVKLYGFHQYCIYDKDFVLERDAREFYDKPSAELVPHVTYKMLEHRAAGAHRFRRIDGKNL